MTVWNFLLLLLVAGTIVAVLGGILALKLQGERTAFKADYQRAHFHKGTALALSTTRSSIRLKAGKAAKTYSFSNVRAWEKHWHNYNREGTLTLNVRDTDHPVWTIKFGNEMNMNKWYELISQAINEKLKL
ncbi:DUF4755 domain-containing protein [Xanthomonas translucens]|uniref:DUF4755 domain-containing protein n=1 Tax=Xanthomonas campestris pv. translucens TaxID=343 RepID=UPI0021B79C1A|nr:DUF4755 domain-containing protein [Xanthomonas translucens]MCT8275832.1 DUF4755 domain-containing protein [Xanthomonas translucens pv. translucens]MCT8278614.1 DUF4755 domain-containing protein [Xanthomonas translucens pv. translucens]WLA10146.1 DUF4755 domain-containing protein [Xanthomonas translucens]WNJ27666.1 DUF4755 domain-containing protein [Xanthomonas translucens pv. translucens]